MSKQLAISSAFSVFAMAAFVLFATAGDLPRERDGHATGAATNATAPAFDRHVPDIVSLIGG